METRSGGSGSASGGGGGGRMRLRKTESAEMRWVVSGGAYEEDEIESSDGGGGTPAAASGSRGGCSDSDDNYEEAEMLRQRLVRTGPRADSLDVEAQDVAGMNRHQVRAPARAPTGNTGPCLKSAASTFVRANCSMYCLRVPDTYQSWSSTLVIVLD